MGESAGHLFEPLFPRWPADEVPVGHVTNGVHMPTWDSAPADDLWTEACGKDRWLGPTETLGQDMRRVSDATLWQFRTAASRSLVEYAREQLSRQLAASGASAEAVDEAKHLFDPNALTLGFARRFATYKTAEPAAARSRSDCCVCCPILSARCNSSSPAKPTRRTRQGRR